MIQMFEAMQKQCHVLFIFIICVEEKPGVERATCMLSAQGLVLRPVESPEEL